MGQLSEILIRAAWLYGDRIAVRQGEITLTYSQLSVRVSRLAAAMIANGLRPGDRVAILARNSFRNLEVHLACAHAGVVLVPLNIRLAAAEVSRILHLTQTKLLFAALPYQPKVIPRIEWDDADGLASHNAYEGWISAHDAIAPVVRAESDLAEIYFTSGTTGEPKGACLTERNLKTSALDAIMTLELTGRSVWFHAPPMFHLVDAFAIWALTLVGGCHVTEHFDPARFCAVVQQAGVTVASLPPTLLDMIVRSEDFREYDLSSLERISFGGAPMPEPIYQRCAAAFPCSLVQSYGTTETSGTVCQQMPDDVIPDAWINSIGQPVPHIKIVILDGERNVVGPGVIGELAISGDRVMAGYWQNEAATRAAFYGDYYLTGDLGACDARGHFAILGRKKEMIISGGENVYPAEVERALLSCANVVEAAVFGVPHPVWGEEVRAVVVLDSHARLTPQQLIEHCRDHLGGYKVPKIIQISAEPLPKTGPGKIAKTIVRERHMEAHAHAAV